MNGHDEDAFDRAYGPSDDDDLARQVDDEAWDAYWDAEEAAEWRQYCDAHKCPRCRATLSRVLFGGGWNCGGCRVTYTDGEEDYEPPPPTVWHGPSCPTCGQPTLDRGGWALFECANCDVIWRTQEEIERVAADLAAEGWAQ